MRKKFFALVAELAGRSINKIPGVSAAVCAVTGVAVLGGAGWALLTAAAALLAVDARLP